MPRDGTSLPSSGDYSDEGEHDDETYDDSEMDEDESYGYMRPGYTPGTGRPDAGYAGGAPGYPPGQAPASPPPPPPGFGDLAQFAFQQGRDSDAFNYLYAWALTSDEGAAEVLPKIQWVGGLKSPALAVRWGVGVHISPEDYKGDLKPLGSVQRTSASRGASGESGNYSGESTDYAGESGGYDDGFGAPGGTGAGRSTALARYAGELADRFISEFEKRRLEGKFGEQLQQVAMGGPRAGGRGYGGESGMYGEGDMYGDSEEGDYGDYDSAGPESGYSGMPPGGSYGGAGMSRGAPGMYGAAGRPGAAPAAGPPQIVPGLSFLGIGTDKELLERAAKEGLQVLVLLDVEVKENVRTKLITNETKIRLYDVNKKDRLKTRDQQVLRPSTFNNLEIQYRRNKNLDDGVEKEFDRLFDVVDAELTVSPIPEVIKPEHVIERVKALLAAEPENPLPALTEMRFWQRSNLLSEEHLATAFKHLIGEEAGEQLATGEEEAKKEVVLKWLPKT
jgi:hypothetical protein